MRSMKKALVAAMVLCVAGSVASAAEAQKFEAYAHPGMFGAQAQETATGEYKYIVGAKDIKSKNYVSIHDKHRVYVDSWTSNVMSLIKDNANYAGGFDEKMPVLRSELAVILSEGFGLTGTPDKQYDDIANGYWAKKWIDGALASGVMIGYPDNNFRPDQPVTKAEVFATIAQLIEVKTDKSLVMPYYKNNEFQYIPQWAIAPTKEVVASNLLDSVPNSDKITNDEYLSKEQVAYLVGALRQDWAIKNKIKRDANAPQQVQNYAPTVVRIKLNDRISARQSNVGDKFAATTTADVTVDGTCFAAGSTVTGEVLEVVRPGLCHDGYIKIRFNEIKNGDCCAEIPANITSAEADVCKDPNVLARLVGAPFSASARVAGVAGRTASAGANVVSNGVEQFGDQVSNVFLDTCSLKPVSSLKNAGGAAVTVGKGIYNLGKLTLTGVYGVCYEFVDEARYLIVPAYSNESSLNPNEEITIVF